MQASESPPPASGEDACEGEELLISLRLLSGEPLGAPLRLPDAAPVAALKRRAAAALPGCGARALQLLWEGRLLEDGCSLREAGLPSGAAPQLIVSAQRHFESVLRCRPKTRFERESDRPPPVSLDPQHATACVTQATANGGTKERVFELDAVYPETSTQQELFEGSVRHLVLGALEGRSCTILAFGPTGTGKRHTLFGGPAPEEEGLLPRTFDALATGIAERPGKQFVLLASFMLVFGSGMYDLLAPESASRIRVREAPGRTRVEGLAPRPARCAGELRAVLAEGLAALERRMLASGGCRSRRWSLVFSIEVRMQDRLPEGGWRARTAKIHVVKVCGSERGHVPSPIVGLREVQDLQDVRGLQRVVWALVRAQRDQKKQHFVPWRDARLTHLLRDSFLHGSVMFICTCARHEMYLDETLSTLMFADHARQVRFQALAQESMPEEVGEGPPEDFLCEGLWTGKPDACGSGGAFCS